MPINFPTVCVCVCICRDIDNTIANGTSAELIKNLRTTNAQNSNRILNAPTRVSHISDYTLFCRIVSFLLFIDSLSDKLNLL